ncbi:MAG: threonine/serine dehydratase [Candidatus Dormibacteraeota bacterium]|nr:threonine/serine dehydratase [Candidatus Dormibacteraeota bacterium]
MTGPPEESVDAFVAEHGAEIIAASQRIAGHVRRTPVLPTDIDPAVRLKPENLQVTGSFKVRGAFNAVLSLLERRPDVTTVCSVSSGNHAQAVACAARTCGIGAVIVIPEGANPIKVAATRAWGAEVVSQGVTFDNREAFTAELAAARGLPIVHPFDDWDVIHGQASAGLELLEDAPELDAIVTPVGGGGLLSGIALAVRHLGREVKMIGVEPESADDAARSFATGQHQRLATTPATMADGVKVLSIGDRNFDVLVRHHLADAIVTVSEDSIRSAVDEIWRRARLVVEPTAALPLAAYRAGRLPLTANATVGLVLTGGNVDPALVRDLLA